MTQPAARHEPFGFGCPRRDTDDGPSQCVLCYRALVRACARMLYGMVS